MSLFATSQVEGETKNHGHKMEWSGRLRRDMPVVDRLLMLEQVTALVVWRNVHFLLILAPRHCCEQVKLEKLDQMKQAKAKVSLRRKRACHLARAWH